MNKINRRFPAVIFAALSCVPASAAPQAAGGGTIVLDCSKPSAPCYEWAKNLPADPEADKYHMPPPPRRYDPAMEYPQLRDVFNIPYPPAEPAPTAAGKKKPVLPAPCRAEKPAAGKAAASAPAKKRKAPPAKNALDQTAANPSSGAPFDGGAAKAKGPEPVQVPPPGAVAGKPLQAGDRYLKPGQPSAVVKQAVPPPASAPKEGSAKEKGGSVGETALWGAIVGGVFGLIAGGPFGLVLGGVIGAGAGAILGNFL